MVSYEKGTDPRKTPEWREAENWHSRLHTHPVFSIIGEVLQPGPASEELDQAMEEILKVCPMYFPLLFLRGEYMLRTGRTSEGEELIDKAFNTMTNIIEDEDEFRQVLSSHMGKLEKLLRYDLAARYTEKAVRLFPDTAAYYDELAFYILQLPEGDKKEALRREEQALEIEPDNDYFINNLGWIHLMMGNYEEAEENFQKALEFNIENTTACDNRDTAEYMHEHRLSYFDYLVRPVDMGQLNTLLGHGDLEEIAAICRVYNNDRLEAFKIHHLQKRTGTLPPHEILNTIQPLEMFMNAVENAVDVVEDGFFLYENLDIWGKKSRSLVYQFIIETDHVDKQLLEDISQSLTVFYGFLREANLVTSHRYDRFSGHIHPLITEFSRKIDEYHRLRCDVDLEEAEREEKIERLFDIK